MSVRREIVGGRTRLSLSQFPGLLFLVALVQRVEQRVMPLQCFATRLHSSSPFWYIGGWDRLARSAEAT